MTFSPLFAAYRAATFLGEPAARPFLRWRQRSGKEDTARIGERMGLPSRRRPPGEVAWLHGASVGEGLALLPLIDALVGRGLQVLVTTGTVSSARVMASRLPAGVTHQFVPLDFPRFLSRFLEHWRPNLVMLAESELWPNLVHEVVRRGTPLVLVNARMSDRSFRRWTRAAGFIGSLLGRAVICLAQTEQDAERFRRLGAAHVSVTGNLKFDVGPPPANSDSVSEMVARIGARPVWVAASTHAEEESLLLAVHQDVVRDHPDLITILVPRRADRGPAISETCAARGIPVALRSRRDPLPVGAGIYVADTMGELGLFYRVTDIVFLGKSLAGGGGQNPIEAAKLGNAVLYGPMVGNFARSMPTWPRPAGPSKSPTGRLCPKRFRAFWPIRRGCAAWPGQPPRLSSRQGGATAKVMQAIAPLLGTRLASPAN